MKNADSPAMPHVAKCSLTTVADGAIGVTPIMEFSGLTKREMMAMHLHAALLTAQADGVWSGIGVNAAFHAVQEADELLAELDRTSK